MWTPAYIPTDCLTSWGVLHHEYLYISCYLSDNKPVLSYLLLCLLLHWWPRRDWSLQPHLRWASSQTVTRPSCRQCDKPYCRQCDNPTWSKTAFLSRFHARCRSSFQLHNRWSRLLGGALWRACNLTSFSPCLTCPVNYPFASRYKGPGFKSPGGTYVKPGFSC